ncbi:MAG: dipeptidase [Thermaerobacterales bacterium]
MPLPSFDALKKESRTLHHEALVVDGHCDTVLALVSGQRKLGERARKGHIDLPRLRDGGVNAQVFALYIEADYKPDRSLPRLIEQLDVFLEAVDACSDQIAVVKTVADILRFKDEGKVGAIIGIEGGEALGGSIAALRIFYRLGVRLIGLTWNQRNDLADGVDEARTGGGLTNFGVTVVKEMNRLGMVVDVSHLSDASFWHVLQTSGQPVVASHSNCRRLCPHPRNLGDDQILALADNGGVMGMNFFPPFLDSRRATLDHVMHHVEHVLDLVGPDHVALGTDFDGIEDTPVGLEDVTRLPDLTTRMMRRGYSEEVIHKILGGNYLRVFSQVWAAGSDRR